MINFWNKLTTHLAGTEHQALYRQKLEKVDQSFEILKETTIYSEIVFIRYLHEIGTVELVKSAVTNM